jgi:glycosyltransferase involved in cell wall biosynthesis
MEAMASGLPCVASNIRGNTDLLENTEGGFLCNVNDVSEYTEKLNLLVSNSELRATMGEHNLAAIQRFSTETVIKEMRNIYATEFF